MKKGLKEKARDHFVPHEGNQYEPHFWRHKSLLIMLSIVAIIELGFLVQAFIVFDKTNFLATVLPGVLTDMTNSERAQNSLPTLSSNSLLEKAAQAKAQDMAEKGYFAHTSPDGTTPWYWIREAGYDFKYAGENLAVNFFESKDVADAWMNSPTHRANILKNEYKEIGIATASGVYKGRDAVFVVQFFGTPNEVTPLIVTTPKNTTVTKVEPNKVATIPERIEEPSESSDSNSPNVITANVDTEPRPAETIVLGEATFADKALSSPRYTVNSVYFILAVLLALPLGIFFLVRSERKHPMVLARAATLLVIVGLLSILNLNIARYTIDIGDSGIETTS